ncbi:hypothetical protein D3C73_1673650 [compost metagenome]
MAEQALQLSSRPDLESGLSVLSPDKVVNYAAQQASEVNKADSMEIEEAFVMSK